MTKFSNKIIFSFIITAFISGLLISPYIDKSLGNIPDLCYSDLQPSIYITKDPSANIIENPELNEIRIYGGNKQITTGQIAPTGSMRSALGDGSIILMITNLSESDIKIGDIVSIKREEGKNDLAHRVVNIIDTDEGQVYQTKGDNNRNPDLMIWKFDQIKGKIVGVIY